MNIKNGCLWLVGIGLLAFTGCDGNGGGGTGGDGGSGATGGGGSNTGGCCAEGGGGSSQGGGGSNQGGGGSNQGGGAPIGSECGGIAGIQCVDTAYCDYAENLCGADDGTGTCALRPDSCDQVLDPVCACDGTIYDNECVAAAAGVDVSNLGGCPIGQGEFKCGSKICASAQQYCQHEISDVSGYPDGYACKDLPAGCFMGAEPSCACLEAEACGSFCEQDPASGDLTLTCPGG